MSLAETLGGTILGGFIAGIVGFLSARYERLLRRREAHMREHEKNFDVIQESLADLKSQIWPLTAKGAENLSLPKWDRPQHTKQLCRFSVTDYQRFEPISDNPLGTRFKLIAVDRILYSDTPNHFSTIARQLDEVEKVARKDGVKLDELTFDLIAEIWKSMATSDLTVLKWTFDQGKTIPLREIASSDNIESRGYGGWLFLLVIGEDSANWPINYKDLERYGLLGKLTGLAGEIKGKSEEHVSEILRLKNRIFGLIDHSSETLELEKHKSSLKGRCQYV